MTPMEGRRPFSNPKLEAWRIVRWWGGSEQPIGIVAAHRKWCDDHRVKDPNWRKKTLAYSQAMVEELARKQLRATDPIAGKSRRRGDV